MLKQYSLILNEEIDFNEALDRAMEPIREFMFKQTRNKDLALFLNISNDRRIEFFRGYTK